jgi:hypothetical protein
MARAVVESQSDYSYTTPDTLLETRLISGGPVVSSIPVKGHTFEYKKGGLSSFTSKKNANAVIAFHNALGAKFVLTNKK